MNHPPEPWRIELGFESHHLLDAENNILLTSEHPFWKHIPHIVACVNALAGAPIELLEAVDQKEIITAIGTREAILSVFRDSPEWAPAVAWERRLEDRRCKLSEGSDGDTWAGCVLDAGHDGSCEMRARPQWVREAAERKGK